MFRNLFSKKTAPAAVGDDLAFEPRADALPIDALDTCVGGRSEPNGVDCYLHSTPSQVH